jgi:hypothetical protein
VEQGRRAKEGFGISYISEIAANCAMDESS